MALICVTPPALEPVTLAEAKAHLRVEIDDDDALISALITVAREYVEATARPQLALLTQTWRYVNDRWPTGDTLELRPYPLRSVSSITYTDEDDVTTTFDADNYLVDIYSEPGRIRLKAGTSWPTDTLAELNGLVVEFVAGFGDTPADVPRRLRQAILLLVGHWYENRELAILSGAVPQELPLAVKALLSHWRREAG